MPTMSGRVRVHRAILPGRRSGARALAQATPPPARTAPAPPGRAANPAAHGFAGTIEQRADDATVEIAGAEQGVAKRKCEIEVSRLHEAKHMVDGVHAAHRVNQRKCPSQGCRSSSRCESVCSPSYIR